jgi:hypothetical protein
MSLGSRGCDLWPCQFLSLFMKNQEGGHEARIAPEAAGLWGGWAKGKNEPILHNGHMCTCPVPRGEGSDLGGKGEPQ